MKHEDFGKIAQVVSDLVASSLVARKFNGVVEVDESSFDNEEKFLRILVHFTDLDHLSEDDVDTVASSIEGAVTEIDDRFPSVRFSDN